jgi:hypothetical protein
MNIDELISFLKHYTIKGDKVEMSEEGEETPTTADPTTPTGGAAGYPTVTKWETGLTRSVANQIDYNVTWKSLNKLVRGKANTLL